ncbi:MAG: tyrosine-type recombinase/integrase [Xenococcus sp. MO_188.B8]|nr:tyrosine-type recombinase/integrase [Xenococcus sp. MO_188.B8]
MNRKRTNAAKKAKELAKYLRKEDPDYSYLRDVFRHLRQELKVEVPSPSKKTSDLRTSSLTKEDIKLYYDTVQKSGNLQDMAIVKVLLCMGLRTGDLVNIKLTDVDLERSQIRLNISKTGKKTVVRFPKSLREILRKHIEVMTQKKAINLFESSWGKKYTTRGIYKIATKYGKLAGFSQPVSPNQLRNFFLKWLEEQEEKEKFSKSQIDLKNYEKFMEKFPI